MRLYIAEKPDVAKYILEAIDGNSEKFDGYFQKGNNIVTWCYGHLLELCPPQAYGEQYEKWDLSTLPLPIPTKYKPIDKAKKQFDVVVKLLNRQDVSEIVHAGDPDEEGQLLVDEILAWGKNKKPVYRLLLQDFTEKAVKKEIASMKPNSEYKGISESGYARSQADWLVGLSLTRAFTVLANTGGKQIISVGRVQTPMLGLIVARDFEKENHKVSYYYPVKANFDIAGQKFDNVSLKGDKILDPDEAKKIAEFCKGKPAELVVKKENKETPPPLPYSLLKLQIDCAKRWKYSPDDVMTITQSLREKHRAITYNRSDCEFLPESMWDSRNTILDNLDGIVDLSRVDRSVKSKAFNDKKITAHYAIIPTENKVDISKFSEKERNVYTLIAQRFALQFWPNKKYISYTLSFGVGEYVFLSIVNKTIDKGFSAIYEDDIKEKDVENKEEDVATDFDANSGNGECVECIVEKKETKPRPYYTLVTLLADLLSVSKYVKDERIKKLLLAKDKDKDASERGGIGTPATRSVILKTLFDRGYIQEVKNNIISTTLGRELIKNSPTLLSQPDLTALWFEQQEDIRQGKMTRDEFLNECSKMVAEIIQEKKGSDMSSVGLDKTYPCSCGKGYLQRRQKKDKSGYFWGCSDWQNGCKVIVSDYKGKPDLKGESKKESSGKESGVTCPECKKGVLIGHKATSKDGKPYIWFGCSEWKNGCGFKCFGDDKGNPKIG